MPLSHNTTIRTLVPLVALALTATGCSSSETSPAYELTAGPTDATWCAAGDDLWFYEQADLVGPHFSISVLCHFEGTEPPESLAAKESLLADLPPTADGVDLVLNQFALGPSLEPEFEAAPVKAWVALGDEEFELDGLPEPGSFLAVTVPENEDAVLWVEDDSRAQGLDLRTGARVDPVAAYYGDLATSPVLVEIFFYEEVTVRNGSGGWDLTCGSDFLEADRGAWHEDQGWAPEGTVFLQVRFNWCTYEDNLVWHLDEDAALSVASGDEQIAPLSWDTAELESSARTLRYTVVFAIPEDAATATLVFTPVGDLENLDGGEDYAFVETPGSIERELVF
ncbi:hypothetical protein [Glycomyces sp. NRRL B-16210]|uniref:hypothetical protein n=1 Tax=Glycomyces sp. NRRL B-16210 TaxID=1463821 RepID=UPI0004BF4528|nr:hypothetical protein [Glycomyces sp. NRRL B-16210]